MGATDFTLTVLGARGSMAVGGPENYEFGGSTSCYMVKAGEEVLFLDAGSGLLSAPVFFDKTPVILLSHLHLDHLMGLGMFPTLSLKGQEVSLYVPFCTDAEEARAKLDAVFSPPYWPVRLGNLGSDLGIFPLPERMTVGDVQVETMPGNHPGGCIIFKIRYAGKTLVCATDYEHDEETDEKLVAFSKDADLLLYDAQFTEEEYVRRKGFGHSTAQKGMEIMARSGTRRLLLIHHAPNSSDRTLREREASFGSPCISYAREGQVLSL